MTSNRGSLYRSCALTAALAVVITAGAAAAQDTAPGSAVPASPAAAAPAAGTADMGAGATSAALTPDEQAQWNTIQAAIDAKDYRKAEPLLRTWLTTHPADQNAGRLLGYALLFQNKYSAALDQFNSLLTLQPDNADFLYGKALTLVRSGHPADAIPLLDQARQNGVNTEIVYRLELQALRMTGDTQKLATVQAEAAQKFPTVDWTAAAAAPAGAGTSTVPPASTTPTTVDLRYEHDWLDHGYKDWNILDLSASKVLAPNEFIYGGAETGSRFGFTDQMFDIGGRYPINPQTYVQAEGDYSPSAKILPRFSFLVQAGHTLTNGFGIAASERHSEYTSFTTGSSFSTDIQSITLDRGWDLYRAAVSVNFAEISHGSGAGVSVTGQLNRYYGPLNRSVVGIVLTGGQTVVNVGPPVGGIKSNTFDADLTGVHMLNAEWGALYDLGYHKLGSIYSRKTIAIGARRVF